MTATATPMSKLSEAAIDAAAPNAEAAKNGRALVLKGQLQNLSVSGDGELLFGECKGSGKVPYSCSCDFADPATPTHRCTCPSRQFPCKHCLALMYARAQGKAFAVAEVPPELQAKRAKLAGRKEKQAETPTEAAPKKVNAAALAKKVKAQLAGIDTLETLTHDLVRLGIGNVNAKLASEMEAQANQLGDAYLPGARAALYRYTQLFKDSGGAARKPGAAEVERTHTEALDQLTRLHALIKQGRAYLAARLSDPELALPTDSPIAAWLGHAWTLAELRAAGLVEANVELVQLAFHSHDDAARQEFIDSGTWMSLNTGHVRVTQTLRPYKAVRHLRAEDSFFEVAQVPKLCVYPGGPNPRVRWEGGTSRPLVAADFAAIRGHAKSDFAAAIKGVKAALKNPLGDKTPVVALSYKAVHKVGERIVVEDAAGVRVALCDDGAPEEPPSLHLLSLLPQSALSGQTLVARFRHDFAARRLEAKPLAVVTSGAVVRLTL